ncbi:Cldn13 [Lemmus lemmus]
MVCMEQEAISFLVATLSWLCATVSRILPIWRVTFPEDEANPDARVWEGLQHTCWAQKSSGMQCTLHGTQPIVAQALSVSRVFMEPG